MLKSNRTARPWGGALADRVVAHEDFHADQGADLSIRFCSRRKTASELRSPEDLVGGWPADEKRMRKSRKTSFNFFQHETSAA